MDIWALIAVMLFNWCVLLPFGIWFSLQRADPEGNFAQRYWSGVWRDAWEEARTKADSNGASMYSAQHVTSRRRNRTGSGT